jgi:hypothetical protein
MSDPIASAADLGVYLGDPTIATDRATLILMLAQIKCELYVSPLPYDALPIVLEVAARAYSNATSEHSIAIGSAAISYGSAGSNVGIGGLYLSRSNVKELRLIAGRSGAFSIDLLPKGTTQVQLLTVVATAGTYLVGLDGANTAPVAFDAPLLTVQTALQAIPSIGPGNLLVTGVVGDYILTYAGRLLTTPIPALTVDTTALTGTAAVTMVTPGVYTPGQNMPWWDWTG